MLPWVHHESRSDVRWSTRSGIGALRCYRLWIAFITAVHQLEHSETSIHSSWEASGGIHKLALGFSERGWRKSEQMKYCSSLDAKIKCSRLPRSESSESCLKNEVLRCHTVASCVPISTNSWSWRACSMGF